jgi:hypothetical protein
MAYLLLRMLEQNSAGTDAAQSVIQHRDWISDFTEFRGIFSGAPQLGDALLSLDREPKEKSY